MKQKHANRALPILVKLTRQLTHDELAEFLGKQKLHPGYLLRHIAPASSTARQLSEDLPSSGGAS